MTKQKTPNFESAIAELENVVQSLENGDLSLEDSLKTFERGIALTRQCQTSLQEAEQRVSILMNKNGDVQSEDFDTSSLD